MANDVPAFLLPALAPSNCDSSAPEGFWRWATTADEAGLAGVALGRMVARSPHGLAVGPRGALWHGMATSVSPNGMRSETLLGGWSGTSFCDGSTVFARQGVLVPWVARMPRTMVKGARPRLMDAIVARLPESSPVVARKASQLLAGQGVTAPWFELEPDAGHGLPWDDVRTLVDTLLAPALVQVQRQPGFGLSPMRVVIDGAFCERLDAPLRPARVRLVDTGSFFAPNRWKGWLDQVGTVLQAVLERHGPNGWNPQALIGHTRTPVTYTDPQPRMVGACVGEVAIDSARALSLTAHARFHATAWLAGLGLSIPEVPVDA